MLEYKYRCWNEEMLEYRDVRIKRWTHLGGQSSDCIMAMLFETSKKEGFYALNQYPQ